MKKRRRKKFIGRAVPRFETLRAERLELTDKRGRVRAVVGVNGNYEAVIELRDGKGDLRVQIKVGLGGEVQARGLA